MSLNFNRLLLRPTMSRFSTTSAHVTRKSLPRVAARFANFPLRPTAFALNTRHSYSTETENKKENDSYKTEPEFDPDYTYNKPLAISLAVLSASGFLYLLYKHYSEGTGNVVPKQARINDVESRDNNMKDSSNHTKEDAVISEIPTEEKTLPSPMETLETGDDTEESIAAEVHRSNVMQQVQESEMGEKAQEAQGEGAYNPDTGEINWDCPCLGGMAHGPCGEEFKLAFSCFVYSEADPKGIDCVDKFQGMQDCFRKYPEYYAEQLKDEDESEAEFATHPDDREEAAPVPTSTETKS